MMRLHNKTRGFTLIELMVVISIIGLLSSIVLAAVVEAKNKAMDQRLISDMVSLRTAAQVYKSMMSDKYRFDSSTIVYCTGILLSGGVYSFYGTDPTRGGTSNNGGGATIMADIRTLSAYTTTTGRCFVSDNSYIILVALPSTISTTPTFICLDSRGNIKHETSKGINTTPGAGYTDLGSTVTTDRYICS